MQGRSISTMVLVEGIEVPSVSIRVNGGILSPAEATIEIPAVSAAHKIKPRSLVHVFFAETSYAEGELTSTGRSTTQSLSDRNSYALLFVGEVLAYKYVNAGGLRHIVLQCQDATSYWQQAKLYWGTNRLSSYTYKRAIAVGAVQVFDGKKRVDNTEAFLNLLLSSPTTVPQLTGVLGGVISLLESATGVYRPDAGKNFRGVNDFIGQAELRLQLTQMLGVAPNDNTSTKYIDARVFRQYFKRLARSMSQQASFMELAGLFLERVHYQWSSVLMPPYLPQDTNKKIKSKVLDYKTIKFKPLKETLEDIALIDQVVAKAQARLDAQKTRYTNGKVTAPGDGVLHSEYRRENGAQISVHDLEGQGDFNEGPVEEFRKKDWAARAVSVRQQLGRQGQSLFETKIGTAYNFLIYVKKVLDAIVKSGSVVNTVRGKDGTVYTSALTGYPNHTATNIKDIRANLQKAKALLTGKDVTTSRVVSGRDIQLGDRLHCFLFSPDLYMAPPPTCNVLFPDQYTQIQFSRNWMSELTRLTMHTRTQSGMDAKDLYFAPNTDVLGGPKVKDVEQALTKNVSFMMPHEKYTGVIAAIEVVEGASIFRKIHEEVKRAEKDVKKPDPTKPTNAKVSGEAKFSPMEHLRRAANFLFFQKRFSGRSIVITARFSPQVVTGLPMLVLDGDPAARSRFGTFDPDGRLNTDNRVERSSTGTHFLGLVANVQHGFDGAGQAFTQIQLIKCREHTEGIDIFLDDNDVEGIADKTKTVVTRKATVKWRRKTDYTLGQIPMESKTVTWVNGPEDFSNSVKISSESKKLGPKGGYAGQTSGIEVISNEEAIKAAGFSPKRNASYRIEVDFNPSNVARPGSLEQGGSVEDMDFSIGLTVTEEARGWAPVAVSGEVQFSFEQTATPPWFADIYLPHNIGTQFYEPMLGCKSILDASALSGGGIDSADIVENKRRAYLKLPGTDRQVEVPANILVPARTIQESADRLAETWRGLSESGANVALFIDAYTRRSSGSLPEIMGDRNPYLSFLAGRQISSPPSRPEDQEDGFHGNAYGRFKNLEDQDGAAMSPEGLVSAVETPESSAKKDTRSKSEIGSARPVSPAVDGRLERWDCVWDYQQQALRARGEIK